MDQRVDALIRRLETPAQPDAAFVSGSVADLLLQARQARKSDRSPVGRLRRDLALVVRPRVWWASPQRATLTGVLVIVALILVALLIVVVGSRRHLPPPFGLAGNGRIAYVDKGHIYTADRNGADRRQVTFGPGGEGEPRFSPDGTRMAYRQYALTPNQGSVSAAVADADGQNGIVLARDIRNLSHIAWSPDSQYVAFTGSIAGGPESGWIARADGSVPPNVFTTVDGAWDPTWSPDGTRIAIGANAGLLVMNRDGSGVRRVNQRDFTEIGNRGEIADWSPDGTQLLFTAFTGDGNADYEQEVYVVGLDGRPERLLSPDARRAREPVWSPDSSRVAYMRAGTGLGPIVWITDPSGLAFKKLDGDYGWYQPIWSPDGTKVMVTDDRPGPENLEGPAVRVILDVDGSAPPVVIPAPGITPDDVPDWAGSWQRVATN